MVATYQLSVHSVLLGEKHCCFLEIIAIILKCQIANCYQLSFTLSFREGNICVPIFIKEIFCKSINDVQKYMREFYPLNLPVSVKWCNSYKSLLYMYKAVLHLSDLVYGMFNNYFHLVVISMYLFHTVKFVCLIFVISV